MKTLKEYIVEYSKEKGWSYEYDYDLYETLGCVSKCIYKGEPDRHRWYTLYDSVLKVSIDGEDRFFSDLIVDVHGEDATRQDCGFNIPDLDDLTELYPKEVTTTIYVTKDKL